MPALEDIIYSDDEEDVSAEADFSNLETNITVSPILTTRVHKDHPVTQIIHDLTSAPQKGVWQGWNLREYTKHSKILFGLRLCKRSFFNSRCKRNKARLVAQGHTQEEGIDYKVVFDPVARIEAIRRSICQPPRFKDPNYPNKVYKVVKALYGLHQAPSAWYETLAKYLLENSFQKMKIDQTLFIKKQKGLQVMQKDNGIFISQDKYVAKILRKFGLTDGKSTSTLIDTKKPLLKDLDVLIEAQHHLSNESSLLGVNTPRCDKDSLALMEIMASVFVKKSNDVVKLQALIDRRKAKVDEVEEDEVDNEKVATLEQDKIAQALKITKLKQRVGRLEKKRRTKHFGLKRLKKVGGVGELDDNEDVTLVDVDAEVAMDTNIHGRMVEPAEVEEVLEVVTAAKLMTEVVTTTAHITNVAQVPMASALRKRRGVVIQDPEETAASLVIVHTKDEAFGRKLEAELNANINWNDVLEQVKRREKQDNTVMRYQALKRKTMTEAQARKNMMIYLKNMARFKMDFFKGNNLEQDTTKKQRIEEDAEELKTHLQIVANDDDDVYTKATPIALKVPFVDYKIHHEHNKPYYKIIRADGTH
nr:hypothetical protein [Tanacetum cinerariifolium]